MQFVVDELGAIEFDTRVLFKRKFLDLQTGKYKG
jgi:hypothetical protein